MKKWLLYPLSVISTVVILYTAKNFVSYFSKQDQLLETRASEETYITPTGEKISMDCFDANFNLKAINQNDYGTTLAYKHHLKTYCGKSQEEKNKGKKEMRSKILRHPKIKEILMHHH